MLSRGCPSSEQDSLPICFVNQPCLRLRSGPVTHLTKTFESHHEIALQKADLGFKQQNTPY